MLQRKRELKLQQKKMETFSFLSKIPTAKLFAKCDQKYF